MASGSFNSAEYGNNTKIQLQNSWSSVPNTAGNYSDVTVVSILKYWSLDVGSRTGSISINGSGQNIGVGGIDDDIKGSYYYRQIMTRTVRVYHNEDGTKQCALSAYYPYNGEYSGVWVDSLSASANVTLDPIDRYPDAPTSVVIGAGHGTKVGIGDTVNCAWSGASGTITGYEVQCKRGAGEWTAIGTVSSSEGSGALNYVLSGNGITDNGSGLTIQMRVRALNGALASDWAYSNYLTIEGLMKIKANGSWKNGSTWIKVNGEWKRAKRVWVKVNGTWQET